MADMQRKCFLLKVRKDKLDEYKKAHEAVWPDMLAALSKHGWTNYSLFLREDGLLIGYVETPDWEQALKGMESEEVNTRWQKAMAEYFEEDGLANMTVVEQVFYLK